VLHHDGENRFPPRYGEGHAGAHDEGHDPGDGQEGLGECPKKGGYRNVEYRLGDVGYLPVIYNSMDEILSNCVINRLTMKAELTGQMPENSFVPFMAAGASSLGIRV